jgi:hypothetical protein
MIQGGCNMWEGMGLAAEQVGLGVEGGAGGRVVDTGMQTMLYFRNLCACCCT